LLHHRGDHHGLSLQKSDGGFDEAGMALANAKYSDGHGLTEHRTPAPREARSRPASFSGF
jgi:hypothetical protein